MERNMENTSHEQAEKNGWKILKPLNCEVVGKAVYENPEKTADRIMKSTKRFKVEGGWIYNTTTEYHNEYGVSVAEAICFVPTEANSPNSEK